MFSDFMENCLWQPKVVYFVVFVVAFHLFSCRKSFCRYCRLPIHFHSINCNQFAMYEIWRQYKGSTFGIISKSSNFFKYLQFVSQFRFLANNCFLFPIFQFQIYLYSFYLYPYSFLMYLYWYYDGSVVRLVMTVEWLKLIAVCILLKNLNWLTSRFDSLWKISVTLIQK